MRRAITWVWERGIVSTFLAGLFAILPIVITVAIIGWVAARLSTVGDALERVGGPFVANDSLALVVGGALVLAGIWLLGLFVRTTAKQQLAEKLNVIINRIPVINSIYRPVSQVVGMLKQDDSNKMQGMSVVFCEFGQQHGGGFLGLLASHNTYRFGGQECQVVYFPTSPIPMSGGIVFVPTDQVRRVEMSVDDLMRIYFSLGVLSSQVVPERYVTPGTAT